MRSAVTFLYAKTAVSCLYFYCLFLSTPLRAVPGVYSTAINASLSVLSRFVYGEAEFGTFFSEFTATRT
jgi:hypothetical protein